MFRWLYRPSRLYQQFAQMPPLVSSFGAYWGLVANEIACLPPLASLPVKLSLTCPCLTLWWRTSAVSPQSPIPVSQPGSPVVAHHWAFSRANATRTSSHHAPCCRHWRFQGIHLANRFRGDIRGVGFTWKNLSSRQSAGGRLQLHQAPCPKVSGIWPQRTFLAILTAHTTASAAASSVEQAGSRSLKTDRSLSWLISWHNSCASWPVWSRWRPKTLPQSAGLETWRRRLRGCGGHPGVTAGCGILQTGPRRPRNDRESRAWSRAEVQASVVELAPLRSGETPKVLVLVHGAPAPVRTCWSSSTS